MSDNTENKQTTRNNSNVAVIVTFAIIIAVIAFFIGSYNHLQSMDENVDSSWTSSKCTIHPVTRLFWL